MGGGPLAAGVNRRPHTSWTAKQLGRRTGVLPPLRQAALL